MATQVQNRRGTTAEHSTFTGAVGELTVDTTKDTVVVHDGAVAGGRPLLREDQSNLPTSAPATGIYNNSGALALSTNGTGRLFVDASGNVGVGTSSPVNFINYRTITAQGATTSAGGVYASQTSDASVQALYYTLGGEARLGTTTSTPFTFLTNNSERLRITSDGKLGLGTSSPTSTLEINGTITIGTGGTQTYQAGVIGYTDANWGCLSRPPRAGAIGAYGFQSFAGDTRMVITDDGKVGIGSTTPAFRCQIDNPVALSGSGNDYALVVGNTSSASRRAVALGVDGTSGNAVLAGYNTFSPGLAELQIDGTNLQLKISGSEKARLDSSGRLLVGTSTNLGSAEGYEPRLQVAGSTQGLSIGRYQANNPYGAQLYLQRSKSDTVGGHAVMASGDEVGYISFEGSDGTAFKRAAAITALVDGTPGTNDMPGRLVFSTTADGASSPTERVRITSGGFFKAQGDSSFIGSASNYHEFVSNQSNTVTLIAANQNSSFASAVSSGGCARAANSAYSFQYWYSAYPNSPDLEFNLRGDGNAYADGTWSGGGADYAEYFEWSDSNPDAEDRRGISVVLDGDKIREAVAGEDPIGVISGNPSVIGDAAWNKWSGKHLRDEYGTYILDENGDRQLNPDYDPDQKYIPREQRPEWDCVGLMGKLRIRKGQVIGSRWIKMRDISDSVEEWLVR